jgi:ribosomal protein S18 acetylase RimI-like enzyme
MQIMMPGVKDEYKQYNIGDALLQFQEFYLQNREIKQLISSVKYTSREAVSWYYDTLTRNGFRINEPEGYQMFVDLDSIDFGNPTTHYEILTRNDFDPEDFVQFAVKSYASTPEDLQIHGWDKSVTEPDQIRAIHKYTINGAFGKSPSEWWRVLEKDKIPLGYILGFEMEPERRTRVGTIGNLGVFPEYRRQGLAVLLIHSLLREFQNDGIQYARVGTPTMNVRAIGAYKKAGFIDGNRIQFFRKDI